MPAFKARKTEGWKNFLSPRRSFTLSSSFGAVSKIFRAKWPFISRRKRSYLSVVSSQSGIFLVVVVSVIFGAVMMYLASSPFPMATTSIAPASLRMKIYQSEKYGYRISYPNSWVLTTNEQPSDALEEIVIGAGLDKVTIVTTDKVSLDTLFPALPRPEALKGINGVRYHDYDPVSGVPLDRVVIERPDGYYNEVRGYGKSFERIVKSFSFTTK